MQGNHKYDEEGRYAVQLQEEQNGSWTSVKELEINIRELPKLVLPNVFTPYSSPGSNDYYSINGEMSKNIDQISIRIFSKDGELVFESTDLNFQWNGKDRMGNELQAGTYLAIAEAWNSAGDKVNERQSIYLKR